MPELPEVEAARRAIQDHCLGRKIKKAIVADDSKVIQGVSPSDFEAALVGKTLISALRKGKNLWLQLDSPPFPSFQFGMAGAVYIKGVAVTKYKRSAVKDTDEWPSKYSKLFIEFDDGVEFSFIDKRRFAKVRLLNDPASVPPISGLGPDALLEPMTVDEFYELLSKKKLSIKTLLLDQSVISGIGNWVADEVLYQARIHPLQLASSLSKESCLTLQKCIMEVIEKALEVGADSSQFPNNWMFHSREKKPGMAFVDGKEIDFITIGSRTAAFVPELQKLSGGQVVKNLDKLKRQKSKKKKDEDNADDNDGDVIGYGLIGYGVNEAAKEEDGTVKKPKPIRRELKPRGRGKQPPAEQKPVSSDNNDNKNEEDDSGDVIAADSEGEENNRKRKQQQNGKEAEAKKATNQNSKKPKKAAFSVHQK